MDKHESADARRQRRESLIEEARVASGDPVEALPASLIFGRQAILGWSSGTSIDSEDTLAFSVLAGVRSMNELFPLQRAAEAYERMLKQDVKYRFVIDMSSLK